MRSGAFAPGVAAMCFSKELFKSRTGSQLHRKEKETSPSQALWRRGVAVHFAFAARTGSTVTGKADFVSTQSLIVPKFTIAQLDLDLIPFLKFPFAGYGTLI